MMNSVIVTALALVLLLVIALPAAYALSRFKFKGSKFLNTAFMAGLFINVNYIVVPIFLMLRDGDNWLKKIFGSGFLLNNLFVLAVVYAATALPFTIYLLSGYFSTLAHDYEEAAYIDGANYQTTMWKIIFPMAKPSIITVILFNFLSFWNEYIISMSPFYTEQLDIEGDGVTVECSDVKYSYIINTDGVLEAVYKEYSFERIEGENTVRYCEYIFYGVQSSSK